MSVVPHLPACQVRVLRFYQSCSSPPPSSSFLHFHVHCCLANSWPSSSPTSELSAHCWTSTWDLPSSVRTAGPQPGRPLLPCQLLAKLFANFGAQCALLDLNLGPSQLSAHRWTSTWDLPSSVRTAGLQPATCRAQCAPLDLNLGIECQKICQIECQIECEKICQIKCHKI